MSAIFGVFSQRKNKNVFLRIYAGLYALQHRGQEAMGICLIENEKISEIKGRGLVSDNIKHDNKNSIGGYAGIGHVKYEYSDDDITTLPMPWQYYPDGKDQVIIAVDGKFLDDRDVEEIVGVLNGPIEKIPEYILNLKGAYSIIFAKKDMMIAIRDPHGIKPLSMGKVDSEIIFSTETCGITGSDAEVVRDLQPGEIVVVTKDEVKSLRAGNFTATPCVFDFVYTARPDSFINGTSVYRSRIKMGMELFEEAPVEADIVVGSPDSGMISALGFARASGISYEKAIVRNRYIGRTFILPSDEMRKKGVKMKLSPIRSLIDGKRVVLVDDSIVRGNTIKHVIEILKDSGAKEIHVRIASPPVIRSESLTFDVPSPEKLIANGKTVEDIREYIGADSLAYLSLDGLNKACGNGKFYERCFGGYDPFEEGDEDVN